MALTCDCGVRIPEWDDCNSAYHAGARLDPLSWFVHNYQPPDDGDVLEWRDALADAIDYAVNLAQEVDLEKANRGRAEGGAS